MNDSETGIENASHGVAAEEPGTGTSGTEVQAPGPNEIALWGEAHTYSPAPRYRRRKILRLVKRLEINDVLDVGCGQPLLLRELTERLDIKGFGCDVSEEVMEVCRPMVPGCELKAFDLGQDTWPDNRQFDLVISSEVLEHIPEWGVALRNLGKMSRNYLLITVPSGKIRDTDRLVGHIQHFDRSLLTGAMEQEGFEVIYARQWGFPMHTLYRSLINKLGAERMYESFASSEKYTQRKKAISQLIYGSFFANNLFRTGEQLYVLAKKDNDR